MAGITIANINLIGVTSRGTITRLGDGGAIEQEQTYSAQTANRWQTMAQARVIAQQLRELVWYSRAAGGLFVDSDDHGQVEEGLYHLTEVTATPKLDGNFTAIIEVELSLRRIGGGSANVSRTLYAQANLQANDWSITSSLWYARPVGVAGLEVATAQKTRTGPDGSVFQLGTSTSHQYVMGGADHDKGECKVWETDGSPATFPALIATNWTRVYSPDHEFASVDKCAFGNSWVLFQPIAASYGMHTVYLYDTDDSIWYPLSTDTYSAGSIGTGTSWTHVLIEELTPWRVVVSYWYARGSAPYVVRKRYTLERGKLLALLEITASSSAAAISIGHFDPGAASLLRIAFGNDTTNDRNDAWDLVYDSGNQTISDTDDNWIAVFGSDSDIDTLGIVAVRDNSYSLIADATLDAVYSERSTTTTHEAYVGGMAYTKTSARIEAEAGTLTGTAAIATVASASPGGSNNAVTLPALNDQVLAASTPPALDGTASIVLKTYARVQNVGTSASDTCRVGIYNTTTATHVATKDFTFSALASTGTWKWISIDYTGWNGTDTIGPYVKRQVAGGGGTLYADEFLFVNLNSANGADGPLYLAHVALTEATVWSENSRVGV